MNLFSVMSLFAFVIYLYMGIYTYLLERNSKMNRLFLYFCLSMAVWSFGYAFVYPSNIDNGIWIKISAVGWCTFCAIVLHSTLVFTKSPISNNQLALVLIYIPGFIFLYMSIFLFWPDSLPSKTVQDFFYTGNFLYIFCCLLSSIILVWKWGKRSDKVREKKQAHIITVTCTIPFLMDLIIQTLLPGFGIILHPPIGQIYCLIMMFGIYYASIRYRLFGISSNLLIEEILTEAMDLIILVSPEGRIAKVNNRTEQLLGYRKKELINENVEIIFNETHIIDDIFGNYNLSKIYRYNELNCIKKDGGLIPVSISCSPIIDHRLKDLLAVVIVGQDITFTLNTGLRRVKSGMWESMCLQSP